MIYFQINIHYIVISSSQIWQICSMPLKKFSKQILKIFFINSDCITSVIMTSSSMKSISAFTIDHSQLTSQFIEKISVKQDNSFIWNHEHELINEINVRRWICDYCFSDIKRFWVLSYILNNINQRGRDKPPTRFASPVLPTPTAPPRSISDSCAASLRSRRRPSEPFSIVRPSSIPSGTKKKHVSSTF